MGEGFRLRGVHEVQKADERAAERPEPDPEPEIHAVVEPDDQPGERVCRCARGVPSCSCDSWPSHDAVGGLVVDFEPSRTASGPSRLDAVRTASNSKRNHPRRREMDTSRIEEVKAPPHDVTPYSRRLPGAVGPHGHLHAREDSHAEDLVDPDLPRAPVAEDP